MHTFRAKTEVLTISAASLLLAVIILFVIAITLLLTRGNNELASILVGTNTNTALQETVGQSLTGTIDTAMSNQLLGRAVVFGAWAFVGLATLIIINTIQGAVQKIHQTEEELDYVNQDRESYKHNLIRQNLMRLAIAIAWALYTVVFFRFIITFFVAACYVAIQGDTPFSAYSGLLISSILLLLGVHLHVVMARLFAGRVRLWGN